MKKESRTICYDEQLQLEAYRLEGIVQQFPNHFHDFYVIGYMENGCRDVNCKNQQYLVKAGDIILFNPRDNHSCKAHKQVAMDYRALNIKADVMKSLIKEICNHDKLPHFQTCIINDQEVANYIHELHLMIMDKSAEFEKEEKLLLLISTLVQKYSKPFSDILDEEDESIKKASTFMDEKFSEHITLADICEYSGLSKSTLLRCFTKKIGITPYRYLQTQRINKAKELLESGTSVAEAALLSGFSDQSHFTNFFMTFNGISPGAYRSIFIQPQKDQKDEAV